MVKIGHFSKLMKLNIHLLLCSKRHYIDEIEYPSSPICGEKPKFESNVTSFQFRQNASAWGHPLALRSGGDQCPGNCGLVQGTKHWLLRESCAAIVVDCYRSPQNNHNRKIMEEIQLGNTTIELLLVSGVFP